MSDTDTCSGCGHPMSAHAHLRAGFDCSACECPDYRRGWPWPDHLWIPAAIIVLLAVSFLLGLILPPPGAP